MHLPLMEEFVGTRRVNSRGAKARWESRYVAWKVTEWMVTASNYFEANSIRDSDGFKNHFGKWGVSEMQLSAARNIFDDNLSFFRNRLGAPLSRGKEKLFDIIQNCIRGISIDFKACPLMRLS